MRLAVATPYPEGSTLAVARAAAQTGELEALFTSGYARGTTGWLPARLPVPALQRYRGRRSLPGIPTELVIDCAVRAELARALVSHLPMWQALGSRTMYAAKMAFDRNVARAMPDADVILGIYGSAALTFQAARRRDVFTILNFVNSHPAEHNRYLRELAGLRGGHEFVPDGVARRVERELALADLVLVPSQFVARQLLGRGLPERRLAVLPYGVDPAMFAPRPSGRPNARIRCLYVGQISHRKGIPILLEAASRLPEVEFVLIGPVVSPDTLRATPRNAVRFGSLRAPEVAEQMQRADLFVLPSVEDAYPLAVLEAMASGLPVVVTDHVGSSEMLEPGVNGMVVPAGDADALAEAIQRLALDPELRAKMGRAARARVELAQAWEAYGARVLKRIEEALAVRHGQ
jgi:glycosyltransferase involved in cell wall biosynthesis